MTLMHHSELTNIVRVLKMHDENLFDLYAGLAMMGLIHHFDFGTFRNDPQRLAGWAFDAAEKMMNERNQRKEQPVNGNT
jgi:hypothetical protein